MATRKITDLPLAPLIGDNDTFHISQSGIDKRGDFRFVKDQILQETQSLVDQAEAAADDSEDAAAQAGVFKNQAAAFSSSAALSAADAIREPLAAHGAMFEPTAQDDMSCPATVANQFTVKAGQYRVGSSLIDLPNKVVTLPDAPDGTQTYDSETGEFIQHADSAAAFANLEKVVNGDFAEGSSGWAFLGDGWSISNGEASSPAYTGKLYQDIGLLPNTEYVALLNLVAGSVILQTYNLNGSTVNSLAVVTKDAPVVRFTTGSEVLGGNLYLFARSSGVTVDSISVTKASEAVVTSRKDLVYLQEDGSIGVHEGTNDNPTMVDAGFSAVSGEAGLWVNGGVYATSLVSVQRRNQGGYHPALNEWGCNRVFQDGVNSFKLWYDALAQKLLSTEEAFDFGTSSTNKVPSPSLWGGLAKGSGRPDSKFYDAIYLSDITDLRLQAKAPSATQLEPNYWQNKAVANELRHFVTEGIPVTKVVERGVVETLSTLSGTAVNLSVGNINDYEIGDFVIWVNQDNAVLASGHVRLKAGNPDRAGAVETYTDAIAGTASTKTVNRTNGDIYTILKVEYTEATGADNTWTDVIGDPANYPRQWTGVIDHQSSDGSATRSVGQTIHVDELTTGIGTIGNVYLYFGAELVGDLRVPNYTNTANWLDLGPKAEFLANATGFEGFPLLYGENGEDLIPDGSLKSFKMARKVSASTPLLQVASDDKGTSWSTPSVSADWDSTGNKYDKTHAATRLQLVSYQTPAHIFSDDVNSEILGEQVGYAWGGSNSLAVFGAGFVVNLIGKVPDSVTDVRRIKSWSMDNYLTVGSKFSGSTNAPPAHNFIWNAPPNGNNRGAKALPYLHTDNNQAQLNVLFKEMVYDSALANGHLFTNITGTTTIQKNAGSHYHVIDGVNTGYWLCKITTELALDDNDFSEVDGALIYRTSEVYFTRWDGNGWGDDNKFTVTDNTSTELDDNSNIVLVGTKSTKLPLVVGG